MAAKVTKKTVKKPSEALVYIGPSMTGLPSNTVFLKGRLPAYVAEMAANNIHLAALLVPVSDLQRARRNVVEKGHILNFHATHLREKELKENGL